MTASPSHTVLIVGAGLAGLATAYQLHQQGYHVTLLEYADWPDGFQTNASDPASITLGCHQETTRLFQTLDQGQRSNSDQPIPLEFQLPTRKTVPYQSARLPGAFQWMMSFFSFQGLAWQDRWRLFSHVEQIWEQTETLPADLENRTADEWLTATGQSAEARERVWAPLAQWLTGNALGRLSAATFVQILSTVFLSDASDARLTYRSGTIAKRFLTPMKELLQNHVRFIPMAQPPHIQFGHDGVQEIRLHDGTTLQASWYISALSYHYLLRLLPERFLTRYAYFAHLTELQSLSEIMVQLTVTQTTSLPPRLLLLAGKPFHHLTSTPVGPHEIVVRLTGTETALMGLGEDQMIEAAQTELGSLFPVVPMSDITSRQISRENHAALLLAPGAARLRPIQQSPMTNLLVAGAWTDTGWPANVESALVSARRCADIVTGHRP